MGLLPCGTHTHHIPPIQDTKSPAYVRSGPPRLPLRVLGPLLLVTTLAVVGSGIGLVVTGPAQAGLLRPLHSLAAGELWRRILVERKKCCAPYVRG
jgi:hypothetical protein